jgi:GNAT superfamily N-acetyltransferase
VSELPAGYELVEAPERIDAEAAHAFLSRSYWAAGIPLETARRALAHSLAVAVFHKGRQVALARVVSDRATFAYLADVYVLEDHRGQGLSHVMLDRHPALQGLRRWALFTRDAQALHRTHGYRQYPHPERMMTRDNPECYA